MDGFDPSWCARLNAGRRAAREAAAAPAPSAPPPTPPPGWTPFREVRPPAVHHCECCGARMFDHSCKIVCPNCGYKRDCSDP